MGVRSELNKTMQITIGETTMSLHEYLLRRTIAAHRSLTPISARYSELKCDRVEPHIDFLRDDPEVIATKLYQREDKDHVRALRDMPLLRVNYQDFGMGYNHNMPCAIHSTTEVAILDCGTGHFHPSNKAHAEGWRLVKAESRFQRWLLRFFNTSS